jgi:hypothetical protein
MSKHIHTKAGYQFYWLLLFHAPAPDPQQGSGSRTAKPNQCGIHNTDLIFNADHCCDRSERIAITIRYGKVDKE